MKNIELPLSVEVIKSDGVKCPRCRQYFGLPDNPQNICDKCANAILLVEPEDLYFQFNTEEEKEQFRIEFLGFQECIRESRRKQVEKYFIQGN